MHSSHRFVDIHCHLIPGLDDGPSSLAESLEMARMALADGITTIIATPHQLGAFAENDGATIRARVAQFQETLAQQGIALRVLAGADVRIEADMVAGLRTGRIVTLGDRGRHVLLELPHEMYFPLEPVLAELHQAAIVGILSHPERNAGLMHDPSLIEPLVRAGCLMQITAGSLLGGFGPRSQAVSERLLQRGLVHFVATDAHGPTTRRPLLRRAFERVAQLADEDTAVALCCENPAAVAAGQNVPTDIRPPRAVQWSSWLPWRKAA